MTLSNKEMSGSYVFSAQQFVTDTSCGSLRPRNLTTVVLYPVRCPLLVLYLISIVKKEEKKTKRCSFATVEQKIDEKMDESGVILENSGENMVSS